MLTLIFGFPTAYFIATRPERPRDLALPHHHSVLDEPPDPHLRHAQEVIRNEGLINTLLIKVSASSRADPDHVHRLERSCFGMVYVYLPLMVLPLYASMEKLDFRLVEAATISTPTASRCCIGASSLPLVKPGIIAGSILVFIPSLGAYVTPRVLGGGKNMMLGNLIELQFGQGRNWPLGCGAVDHFC
jgi:spermidine/putrescine transport system permease protein